MNFKKYIKKTLLFFSFSVILLQGDLSAHGGGGGHGGGGHFRGGHGWVGRGYGYGGWGFGLGWGYPYYYGVSPYYYGGYVPSYDTEYCDPMIDPYCPRCGSTRCSRYR